MDRPIKLEVEEPKKTQEQIINDAVQAAITAALGENGAITTAISSAITAAIGTDGAIENWADGRYEPKASVGG